MSDTNVASEMKPQKKVAFANRKYRNDDRMQKDEEELEELLEQQKAGNKEPDEMDAEPANSEEKSFKKRYGDLRRHMQQREQEWTDQLSQLKAQLDAAANKEIKLPTSEEELEEWSAKYPDVAKIVETIAIKKAKEQAASLEERVKAIDEMQVNAKREKAEAELIRLHPDFDEIRSQDDFHEWAEEQPQWVQNALYENETDARSAARAIDLYKADRGITEKKKNKSTSKDAAYSVDSRGTRSRPDAEAGGATFTESQVAKMTAHEYEKLSDDIMEAIRTGKFVYDLSGGAR